MNFSTAPMQGSTLLKPEIAGQAAGYWFGPGEPIPPAPTGLPSGALLPAIGMSFHDHELVCLDLVAVQNYWLPLSELGRYTYRHSSGLLYEETWLFVPVPDVVGGSWSVRFEVTYDESIDPGSIEQRYGTDAAQRARPDAPTVQLRLQRIVTES